MANRSYLYTYHPNEEPKYRDLAEWKSHVPVSHWILVGANPKACSSVLWQVDAKIAIRSEAEQSRKIFLSFLDWLEPQLSQEFRDTAAKVKKLLTRSDRQSTYFHLELGELYELEGLEVDEMERETRWYESVAQKIFEDVRRLVENEETTLNEATDRALQELQDNWETKLGLRFSDILFYHLG